MTHWVCGQRNAISSTLKAQPGLVGSCPLSRASSHCRICPPVRPVSQEMSAKDQTPASARPLWGS